MPRPICRRRLAYAALLVALAVLPQVVHLSHGVAYFPARERELPTVRVRIFELHWYYFEVPSADRAAGILSRWHQYRRLWWVFAAIAACIVIRELLPIPRFFGTDDDEHCD